jgi:hypothetical protein
MKQRHQPLQLKVEEADQKQQYRRKKQHHDNIDNSYPE